MSSQRHFRMWILLLLPVVLVWRSSAADPPRPVEKSEAGSPPLTEAERALVQASLEKLNPLIGEWRGTGQTRSGSNRGAWFETAQWVWNFEGQTAAINYRIESGKQLASARVSFDPRKRQYVLLGELADGGLREYRGTLQHEKLTLESSRDAQGYVHRFTLDRPNEKRAVVRYDARLESQSLYAPVALVGYTRKGTRLTTTESSGPACIVTGGAGTMKVRHQGKEYYVCCTGCREAFLADPETVIAKAKGREGR